MKYLLIVQILFLSLLSSCNENYHLTLDGTSEVAAGLELPATVQGLTALVGQCSPNGSTVSVASLDFDDSTPGPFSCECISGSFDCGSAMIPGTGPNGDDPQFEVSVEDENGNTNTESEEAIVPAVDLIHEGEVDPDTPINLSGTCQPEGSTVTLDSPDMSPSSISCPCSAGTFSCGPVVFTGGGPGGSMPIVDTTLTDPETGNTATDEDIVPIGIFVDINDSFTFNPGPTPQDLPADMGACAPAGATVNIDANPASSMVSSPAVCACNAGAIDCSAVSVVINDADFTLTPTLINGTTTVTDDPADADVPTELTLTSPGGPFDPGDSMSIAGTCSVPGSVVTILLPPEVATIPAGGSPLSCTCSASGTFSVAAGDCGSFTDVTAITGIASADISASILDSDGDSAGPVVQSIIVNTPSVALTGPTTVVPSSAQQALPANMGSCTPDGSAISVAATPASSMTTSPAACTCTAGVVDCSAVSVVINSSDFVLDATLTDGAGNTYPSNPQPVDVPTMVTLAPPGGPFDPGDTVVIGGTCAVPGSTVTVDLPTELSSVPAGETSLSCSCSSTGTYSVAAGDCGSITNVVANTPGTSLDIEASITDVDGDTVGPVTQSVDVNTPSISLSGPTTITASTTPQSLPSDMGVCSPVGSDISVAATPASSMITSPAACTCAAGGVVDCSAVSVVVNSDDFTLEATLTDGAGNDYVSNTQPVDVPAALTIDPPVGPFATGDSVPVSGTCAVPGSVVTVTLPSELETVPAGASPVSCTCQADNTYDLSSGDCAGASDVFASTAGGPVDISASITDPDGDIAGPVTQPVAVDPVSDLVTSISVDKADADVGEVITYTLNITNNGPDGATGVSLTSLCPTGTTFQSDTSGGSYDSATGVWGPVDVANGDSASISFSCMVNAGQGGNTFAGTTTAATSGAADPGTTGDVLTSGDTLVNKYVDVSTSITMENELCGRRDVEINVEVSNAGPDSISNLVVALPCPTNTTYVSYTGAGTYDNVSETWTAGLIASGGSVALDLVCLSSDPSTDLTGVLDITTADIIMSEIETDVSNDGSISSVDLFKSVAELGSPTHTQTTDLVFNTTYTYPSGGVNRVLMVMIGTDYSTEGNIASIVYGGQPLTLLRREQQVEGGFDTGTEVWFLDDADISAATTTDLTVTTNTTGRIWNNIVILPVANVDQSILFFSEDGAALRDDTLSMTVDYNKCSYAITAVTKGNPDNGITFNPPEWSSFGPFLDPQSTFFYGVYSENINVPQTITVRGSDSFRFTGVTATFQVAN